jgi:hypothetical protein
MKMFRIYYLDTKYHVQPTKVYACFTPISGRHHCGEPSCCIPFATYDNARNSSTFKDQYTAYGNCEIEEYDELRPLSINPQTNQLVATEYVQSLGFGFVPYIQEPLTHYFAVVKVFTSDGVKLGIAEEPVDRQYSFLSDLTEQVAAERCKELAVKLGYPEYIEDTAVFIDYEPITDDERSKAITKKHGYYVTTGQKIIEVAVSHKDYGWGLLPEDEIRVLVEPHQGFYREHHRLFHKCYLGDHYLRSIPSEWFEEIFG